MHSIYVKIDLPSIDGCLDNSIPFIYYLHGRWQRNGVDVGIIRIGVYFLLIRPVKVFQISWQWHVLTWKCKFDCVTKFFNLLRFTRLYINMSKTVEFVVICLRRQAIGTSIKFFNFIIIVTLLTVEYIICIIHLKIIIVC